MFILSTLKGSQITLPEESRNYINVNTPQQPSSFIGNNDEKRLNDLKNELNRYKAQLKQTNEEVEKFNNNLNDSEKAPSFNYVPKVIGRIYF